jgi:hypothetical protein
MFQAQEEDAKKIYDYHIHDLSLWGVFLLALQSIFVFCTKFYESMQDWFF